MKGGKLPATTDANVVLGYLDPDFFAGGKMKLDVAAARSAIDEHIAKPMGLTIEEAAAGMYRVACNNMAQGVREVTIKRGFDPREFPFISAGGAGPIHSCLICTELEIPLQIVPRESSVLCAFGMLMSELKHDFVRTFVARLGAIDWTKLAQIIDDMSREGARQLAEERIPEAKRRFEVRFDCRYIKQYHEVSFLVPRELIDRRDNALIARAFHAEHNRLYGYSLEQENTPVEIINVRVQAIGLTGKPYYKEESWAGADASVAAKGRRKVYIPEINAFREVPVLDGHRMHFGNRVSGPAMIEQETTAIFVSASYDCVVDVYGSFAIYQKGREDLVSTCLERETEAAT
jgi:N-methylhydantoinase A